MKPLALFLKELNQTMIQTIKFQNQRALIFVIVRGWMRAILPSPSSGLFTMIALHSIILFNKGNSNIFFVT